MSFDLVLFGGTGDLAWRKLMPALFQAFRHGTLPEGGRIIGVGREDLGHDKYSALIQARFDNVYAQCMQARGHQIINPPAPRETVVVYERPEPVYVYPRHDPYYRRDGYYRRW